MKARVYVTLKPGVLDPQGQAVARTLGRLGYGEVESVRIGKYVELELSETDPERARARIDEMCAQLIANTVIENYQVELVSAGETGAGTGSGATGGHGVMPPDPGGSPPGSPDTIRLRAKEETTAAGDSSGGGRRRRGSR